MKKFPLYPAALILTIYFIFHRRKLVNLKQDLKLIKVYLDSKKLLHTKTFYLKIIYFVNKFVME